MTTYRPQAFYKILIIVSLTLVGLFVYDLLNGVELGGILFLAISIGLLVWSLYMALTVIAVDNKQMNIAPPIVRDRTIEYGQILSVSEEGRLQQAIVITYHPRFASGLLDLDNAESLTLPSVRDQEDLLAWLQDRVPK